MSVRHARLNSIEVRAGGGAALSFELRPGGTVLAPYVGPDFMSVIDYLARGDQPGIDSALRVLRISEMAGSPPTYRLTVRGRELHLGDSGVGAFADLGRLIRQGTNAQQLRRALEHGSALSIINNLH